MYYYQSSEGIKGRPATTHTLTADGTVVSDNDVVQAIKDELEEEFIDYGYLKMTYHLRDKFNYIINPKKVYRLMKKHRLLYKPLSPLPRNKVWVKQLVPVVDKPFSFWEFDIKYLYIAGENRNALLLTVIDVKTRIVFDWILQYSIQKHDVIELLSRIFKHWNLPEAITVRTDNGSQFEAQLVRDYLDEMKVKHEFCHPASPRENAHIESYHSIIERTISRVYEFKDIKEARDTMQRFVTFYNANRIHSGVGYTSPFKYARSIGIDTKQLCIPKDSSVSTEISSISVPEVKTEKKDILIQQPKNSKNNTQLHVKNGLLSTTNKSRISVQF